MDDPLNKLTIAQLKTIIQRSVGDVKIPKSKGLIIKYIHDNGINFDDDDDTVSKKKTKKDPLVDHTFSRSKQPVAGSRRKTVVAMEESDDEDEEGNISTEPTTKPITVANPTKEVKQIGQEQEYDSSEEEKEYTFKYLSGFTIVQLKSKFLANVEPKSIPKKKDQIIQYIIDIHKEDEEEDEKEVEEEIEELVLEESVLEESLDKSEMNIDSNKDVSVGDISTTQINNNNEDIQSIEDISDIEEAIVLDESEDENSKVEDQNIQDDEEVEEDEDLNEEEDEEDEEENIEYRLNQIDTLHKDVKEEDDDNIGLLSSSLQGLIINFLLGGGHSQDSLIQLSGWMVNPALVCRRWFDQVSNLVNYIDVEKYSSPYQHEHIIQLMNGNSNQYSIVRQLKGIHLNGQVEEFDEMLTDDESFKSDNESDDEEEEEATTGSNISTNDITADLSTMSIQNDENEDESLEEEDDDLYIEERKKLTLDSISNVLNGYKFSEHYLTKIIKHVSPLTSATLTNPNSQLMFSLLTATKYSLLRHVTIKLNELNDNNLATALMSNRHIQSINIDINIENNEIISNRVENTVDLENINEDEDEDEDDNEATKNIPQKSHTNNILTALCCQTDVKKLKFKANSGMAEFRFLSSLFKNESLTNLSYHVGPHSDTRYFAVKVDRCFSHLAHNKTLKQLSLGMIGESYSDNFIARDIAKCFVKNRTITHLGLSSRYISNELFLELSNSGQLVKFKLMDDEKPFETLINWIQSNPTSLVHLVLPSLKNIDCQLLSNAFGRIKNLRTLKIKGSVSSKQLDTLATTLSANDTLQHLVLPKESSSKLLQQFIQSSKSLVTFNQKYTPNM